MKKRNLTQRNISALVFSVPAAFCTGVFLLGDRSRPIPSMAELIAAMNGAAISALCLMALLVLWYRRLFTIRNRRTLGFASLGGAVFALCDFFGYNIYFRDSLLRPDASKFSLVFDGLTLLGSFFLFSSLLLGAFSWLEAHPIRPRTTPRSEKWLGANLRSFLLCFGVMMAVSIPLQVIFYPGLTNVDSFVQISEAMGLSPLTDRHPFLHTLMMRLVLGLGTKLFGSIGWGLVFYTFFQSAMMALAVSYSLTYMAKRQIHPALRLGCLLYFSLHPAIACYNISLWKDIWLSYFLMLYVLLLIELCLNPQGFFKRNIHMVGLLLVILGFLFCKNTGIVILVLTLPFLLVPARGHLKKLMAVALAAFLLLGLVRLVLVPAIGLPKGRVGEPLSVPLQQIARTCVYEGDSLTEAQKAAVDELLPYADLPQLYEPHLSDNVKNSLKAEAFQADPMKYAGLWAQLGIQHPRMYLESLLANSCGYWYPNVNYWVIEPTWYFTSGDFMEHVGQQDPDMADYGLDTQDQYLRHYSVHLYELLQTVPGIASLISVAFPFWACFALFLLCLLKKKYRMLPPMVVVLATWLVCICSPVIAEYRYAFPAVVCLPLLTVFTLQDDIRLTETMGIGKKE